jgi:hypothetical protein
MTQDSSSGKTHKSGYRARGVFWGLILIFLGALFLSINQGWLSDRRWWEWLLIGIGTIFVIYALVRAVRPAPRPRWQGRLVIGVVLLCIGAVFMAGFGQWLPLVLVIAGVGVIAFRFLR